MQSEFNLIKDKEIKWFSREYLGMLYAILSGLLYGFLGYFGMSIIRDDISVTNMLFWRFLISTLFIALLLIPKFNKLQDNPKELFKVFLYGIAFYSISSMIYFFASEYIGTGLAMVIFFCHPAIVLLINYLFYKTKITKIYYLAITLIFLGMCCLIDLHELKLDIFGIVLAILSAVLYAAYIVVSKRNTVSPLNSSFMVSLGCTVTCAVLSLMDNSLTVPKEMGVWLNILGIGILSTAVPILFLLLALKYIDSEKVAILSVLEPIFVVIFGILLLGETVSVLQLIGIITVLSAALLTMLSHRFK